MSLNPSQIKVSSVVIIGNRTRL
eukprot:SAG31_NODE_37227_length_306_cov_0.743961_1_plen_22_part_01